jgi:hypothetical protein
MTAIRRFLFSSSLSLFFFSLLTASIIGQSIAGHSVYNNDREDHDGAPISYWRYLVTSHFGRSVMENWQSEWLQFVLFIMATVWLIQQGAADSKNAEDVGEMTDAQQKVAGRADDASPAWAKVRGWRLFLYSHSLVLLMISLFLTSWAAQAVTGWTEHNNERREHDDPPIGLAGYLVNPHFWEDTLQNWQSEFLAVGAITVFSIYLRQRGSTESKKVGSPQGKTGDTP